MLRDHGHNIPTPTVVEHGWDHLRNGSYTNVVDVMVRRLRRKVDDPFEKKLIQTIRGVGYALKAAERMVIETAKKPNQ